MTNPSLADLQERIEATRNEMATVEARQKQLRTDLFAMETAKRALVKLRERDQ